jgi:hypothetical protein
MSYAVRRAMPADLPAILALQRHGFGSQPASHAAAVAGELGSPHRWLWWRPGVPARPIMAGLLPLRGCG